MKNMHIRKAMPPWTRNKNCARNYARNLTRNENRAQFLLRVKLRPQLRPKLQRILPLGAFVLHRQFVLLKPI